MASSSLVESGEITKNYSTINRHSDESIPTTNVPSTLIKNSTSTRWQGFIQRNQGLITALILFIMAILNMADRYIISSVLIDIQVYFKISKATAGFLQTVYLLSFMVFSPLGGYLGDRYNRKYILIASIIIWLIGVIGGSYVASNQFTLFVITRVVFGASTALFETIGVPIIGDRFTDNPVTRDRAIIAYTIGPGIGVGMAYFISLVAKDIRPTDWRFSMRITPAVLIITLIVIILAYIEPERHRKAGESKPLLDGSDESKIEPRRKTFLRDIKVIWKNKTFMLLVVSWTCGLATVGKYEKHIT